MKIDADEKELLESVERGEWKSAGGGKRQRTRYSRYAKATFRKDRRLNIRLSSKDLEAIQKRALAEGLPYQTLIEPSPQVRVRPAQGNLARPSYPGTVRHHSHAFHFERVWSAFVNAERQ
jgi:predicted DNA binding CopG/RHH family protein